MADQSSHYMEARSVVDYETDMLSTFKVGRAFFAVAMIGLGIVYFYFGRFAPGVPPAPPWTPGGRIAAYIVGLLLIGAGACLAALWHERCAAAVMACLFLVCVTVFHMQKFSAIVHSGDTRTVAFETLTLGSVAVALVGGVWAIQIGRILFGFSMIIFGIQHFLYTGYIATLIPKWIPGHLFFVYFTGVAFVAAGLAMLTNVKGSLGALWMAIMFLLWVLCLHGPRVMKALHNGNEWASLFVALGVCGGGFIFAEELKRLK